MGLLTKHSLGQDLSCPFHIFVSFSPFCIRLEPADELAVVFKEDSKENASITQWFTEFFQGRTTPFPLLLSFDGLGPFTTRVLSQLQNIPFGSTASYGQIAEILGNKDASRAVGNACRVNPFPIIIPCHRVVQKKGLGGFAYGTKMKESLLQFEQKLIRLT